MKDAGETEIRVTIPLRVANIYSFGLFFACLFIFGTVFCLIYSWSEFAAGWTAFLLNYGVLAITVVAGMAAHEFLHAVTWAAFCKAGFKSVIFGVKWKHLAPYVHCREFLPLRHYALGALMPGVLLGFLPLIVALCTGSGWLLCFGTFLPLALQEILCLSGSYAISGKVISSLMIRTIWGSSFVPGLSMSNLFILKISVWRLPLESNSKFEPRV